MDAIAAGAWYVLKANVNMAWLVLTLFIVLGIVKAVWRRV